MSSTYGKCTCCGNVGPLDRHHVFHQVKWARALYGHLLDDPRNIQLACPDCHASHRSTKLKHFSEAEFCEAVGVEIRSKTGRVRVTK